MKSEEQPVAIVTGASAGLGLVIAERLMTEGYRVMIVGRDTARLHAAKTRLESAVGSSPRNADASRPEPQVATHCCDLTDQTAVGGLVADVRSTFGKLNVLVNCVGASDRGLIESLDADHAEFLFRQNVVTALLCSQASLPMLEESSGVIVNIGSLASKVGARYIGGYAIAKHALAGMTQQMRLELKPRGVHVGLINPGPIRRDDEGQRYREQINKDLPDQASRPGAGTRVKGLPPETVADGVIRLIQGRRPDMVLPRYLRVLIATGHAFPRLGDWLLLKFTSPGDD
ncbi:MAG: SDR family NAD(P)-dependent oxidoreductase [Rubripirellula sp.]